RAVILSDIPGYANPRRHGRRRKHHSDPRDRSAVDVRTDADVESDPPGRLPAVLRIQRGLISGRVDRVAVPQSDDVRRAAIVKIHTTARVTGKVVAVCARVLDAHLQLVAAS